MDYSILNLTIAVLALCVVVAIMGLSIPVLLWRVLRQADEIASLQKDARALREDVDKLDAVVDGMLSSGRVE